MKSLTTMIEQLEGLLDTADINQWEQGFIGGMIKYKRDTTTLSERQIEIIERIYNKHFA